jgi:hypothetical protein
LLAVAGAAVQQDDVETLRARVAELERELATVTERTNALVADAQERLYWLERWGIDLNRVMTTRTGQWAFRVAKRARNTQRAAVRIRRRLSR